MKKTILLSLFALLLFPMAVNAQPATGIYTSTDLGGLLETGRASTWRTGINSGLPHVLHAQSWDGAVLGAQWEIRCATAASAFAVVDNRVGGVGTVVYTSTFNGGTFAFFAGGWPWGDGTGVLGATTLITTVQFVMISGVSTPVASVVNGNTTGAFDQGCALTFGIGNGAGAGETTSLDPGITKPGDYPTFLADDCNPAPGGQEFGTWGSVMTITFGIDCSVSDEPKSWGGLKSIYR